MLKSWFSLRSFFCGVNLQINLHIGTSRFQVQILIHWMRAWTELILLFLKNFFDRECSKSSRARLESALTELTASLFTDFTEIFIKVIVAIWTVFWTVTNKNNIHFNHFFFKKRTLWLIILSSFCIKFWVLMIDWGLRATNMRSLCSFAWK